MKKIICFLLAAALLCSGALAFKGSGYPAWDGASPAKSAACGSFGGENITLEFDPAPEYSFIADGLATACFFTFDAQEEYYLEFYLMLPEGAAAGDVYTENSELGSGCSIALYEVAPVGEDFYFAGQMQGLAYPAGACFTMEISSAEKTDSAFSVSGKLSAQLPAVSGNLPAQTLLSIENLSFDFSMPLKGAGSSGKIPGPGAVVPAFTLPPDYAVI